MYNTDSFSSYSTCKSHIKPRSSEILLGKIWYGSTSRMDPIDLFHIFLYPTSFRFTSYNPCWSHIVPQTYTINWWDNMAWAENKKWVSHTLLFPHSKLSACNFVICHPRLACNWRFQQVSCLFLGLFMYNTDSFSSYRRRKSQMKPRRSEI